MSLPGRLLLISERLRTQRPLEEVVEQALAAGCRWLLLREKDLPGEELAALARRIVGLCRRYDAAVSISGNLQVAVACQADGVHLPGGASIAEALRILGARRLVGVSAHSPVAAQAAAAAGAGYVTLSPIFATPSKPGYGPALGLSLLRDVADSLPIPVVALGGVTERNAADCLRAGAAAVAVMGSIMRAAEPGRAAAALLAALSD